MIISKFLRICSTSLLAIMIMSASAWAAVPLYLPYPSADPVIMNPFGETDEAAQIISAIQPFYRISAGRSIQISEMPGRGGATAWGTLTEKDGDGYTLAFTNLQSLIMRTMSSRPVYRLDDIVNCNIMAEAPLVLWVPKDSKMSSLPELIRTASAYPNRLIISGTGSGTQTHLATQRLNFLGGIKTIYLPYMGTKTAMLATTLGQAHAAWGLPQLDYGNELGMRPVAVAAEKRLEHMPDVPTFEELGVGLFESAYFGLALPASTPAGTRQAVADHFGKIIAEKGVQDAISKMGLTPKLVELKDIPALVESEKVRLEELMAQFNLE